MRRPRKHLTREEVNDEEGDLEMADSVAYQHTDGNRNHDGSDVMYGVKSERNGTAKNWRSHFVNELFWQFIWKLHLLFVYLQHKHNTD